MAGLGNPVQYFVYTGDPLPRPRLYGYALAGQGVIKFAETEHFRAAMVVAGPPPPPPQAGGRLWRVAGLPDYPVGVELKISKIPAGWLRAVLRHAQEAGDCTAGGEVLYPREQMYHFHWLEGRWRVAVPKQEASPARIEYQGGHEASIALDLHSHHGMTAYFSQTDDADEQGCRFYGVIGRIYDDRPQLRLRVGIFGDWLEVWPGVLFEGLGEFEDPSPNPSPGRGGELVGEEISENDN